MPDLAVVGSGVIGLSLAWQAARLGLDVTVLDAGDLGGQSSRAAAGILGPLAESMEDGPFTALLWAGLQRFPTWIDDLRADQPLNPEYAADGISRLVAPEEADRLRASLAWRQRYDPAVALTDAEVPGYAFALWSPHEGQVYGPRYVRALAGAAAARGVNFSWGAPVTGFLGGPERVQGVRTTAGAVSATWTVLAAGVWVDQVLRPLGRSLGVFPVRGQVLAARAPARPFRAVRYSADGYVAPKANGLVIVGATEDGAGFESHVTLDGVARLMDRARRLAPDLLHLRFERAWAGLRPATPDGLPVIGMLPGLDGLAVAAGHYRNGLLLSALTADIVLHDLVGSPPPAEMDLSPFRPR